MLFVRRAYQKVSLLDVLLVHILWDGVFIEVHHRVGARERLYHLLPHLNIQHMP